MNLSRQKPPLPSEQGGSSIGARCRWVLLATNKPYTKEHVSQMFIDAFGREPDRCYSPEESDTSTWWLGWVTNREAKVWVGMNEC